jgi:arylsulfatase A
VWEGGFRVPYIVRWPGHVPAGTTCDETLSLVDTLATIAALVGEPLPPRDKGAEDSFNMLPAWLGEKTIEPLRSHLIVHSAAGTFAIRRGPWKWIEGNFHPETKPGARRARADQFKPQLLNLTADRAETVDVQQANAVEAKELQALLDKQRTQGFSR